MVGRLKNAEVLEGLEECRIDGGLKKCRNIGGLNRMQKGLRAKNIAGCLKGYVEYNKVGPLEGRRGSEGQKNAGRLEDSEEYRMVGGLRE